MKILYFTATGNNLYVAKKIGGEYYSIPKIIKEGNFEFEDEKIGLVFPIYGLGVPKIIEEFLGKVKLNSKYIFAVATYGAFAGGVTNHLLEIGKRNNIEFSYINELLMVDNFLPGFDITKQMEKEPKKNIEENLAKIVDDIKVGRKHIKKHPIVRSLTKLMNQNDSSKQFVKNFYVESNCNGCKTCEKVCPIDNIKVDTKPSFYDNCQSCLACINNCPQNAIRLKNEKSRARFRNQNIKLKEIIEANN